MIKIKENFLDKAVSFLSPSVGFKRRQAKIHLAVTDSYTGARRDKRQTKSWKVTDGSADADQIPEMEILRKRSRDLVRNAPIATGAINTVVSNVVGTGLKVQSRVNRDVLIGVVGNTDEEIDVWERNAERMFRNWAEDKRCDSTQHQNFAQMQGLVLRSCLESGDTFIYRRYINRGQRLGTSLQIIEADRVINPNFMPDTKELVAGIEIDLYGSPVAYNVLNRHPGDLIERGSKTVRIRAFDSNNMRQVYHIFHKIRPGQNRGVVYLAPIIEPLKMLDKYTEAEIMAAVISGMFTTFIKSETNQTFNPYAPASEASGVDGDDMALGNGAIVNLAPGESIENANPGRPNTSFDAFIQSILRQIGVALELPFEILIKHYTASYSASQAAILEAWKFFITRRQWMISDFCQPVYEAVISEAIANGYINAPGFFENEDLKKAYLGTEWIGMPRSQIDQRKEVEAAEKRITLGITTISEETASMTGKDWERNHPQTVKEYKMRKDAGIIGTPENTANQAPENEQEEMED